MHENVSCLTRGRTHFFPPQTFPWIRKRGIHHMNAQATLRDGNRERNRRRRKMRIKNDLVAYSFILPNFLGFAVFTLVPLVFAMALSFFNWNGANVIQFNGLDNFRKLFTTDSTFQISLLNTIIFTLGTVPLTMFFALVLAILLNGGLRGTKVFRAIFFFPYVASIVAVGAVWNMIFSPKLGPLNQFLISVGIHNPPGWLSSTHWALFTIILISVWKGMGYNMVLYLAGLQGIPRELYEAATVDGANGWQKFKHITWPLLTPTTFFVSIMLVVSSFKVFDLISIVTQGGPGRATNVLVYYIYDLAFQQSRYGYANAVAMVLFAIVLVITLFQFKAEEKFVDYL